MGSYTRVLRKQHKQNASQFHSRLELRLAMYSRNAQTDTSTMFKFLLYTLTTQSILREIHLEHTCATCIHKIPCYLVCVIGANNKHSICTDSFIYHILLFTLLSLHSQSWDNLLLLNVSYMVDCVWGNCWASSLSSSLCVVCWITFLANLVTLRLSKKSAVVGWWIVSSRNLLFE